MKFYNDFIFWVFIIWGFCRIVKFEEFDFRIIMIDFGDKNDNDEIDLFFFEIFGDSMEEEIVF